MNAADTLRPHPAAEIFPLMADAEIETLAFDIVEHGLREPIILHDGLILDGRNRLRACEVAGVEPRFVEWDGEGGDAQTFVVSKNLHRRHLNETQRSAIAARLATAKAGERTDLVDKATRSSLTLSDAARLMNVDRSTAASARVILERGTAEEVAALEAGTLGVRPTADRIRRGASPIERKQARKSDISQSGKNPERIQRRQINSELWRNVRDGLTALASLPLPDDVIPAVRAQDRGGLVDAKLAAALQWLTEFSHGWNRDQA